MSKIKYKITGEDVACIITLLIGGVYAIVNPEYTSEAFNRTIWGIVLIKIFW